MFQRLSVVIFVCLFAGCGPGAPSGNAGPPRAVATSLRGTAPAQVARVEAIGDSGAGHSAAVNQGAFTVEIPAEPWVLVFRGANGAPIANLVTPASTGSGRTVGVFPARREAPGQPLEGHPSRLKQPLLEGTVVFIGVVTFDGREAMAQYSVLADVDSDGDGLSDLDDPDDDGDGVLDGDEPRPALDLDGDGLCASVDQDDDGDGVSDADDEDDDGDGVADRLERDEDGDGIPDAQDPDDDGDGIDDDQQPHDVTPEALIGTWVGVSEVTDFTFAQGRPVQLQEQLEFHADGTLYEHLTGTDAESGCAIDYELHGTWGEPDETSAMLDVTLSQVWGDVSGCTDAAFDSHQEVDAAELETWADELEGVWWVSTDALVIQLNNGGVLEYERAE